MKDRFLHNIPELLLYVYFFCIFEYNHLIINGYTPYYLIAPIP